MQRPHIRLRSWWKNTKSNRVFMVAQKGYADVDKKSVEHVWLLEYLTEEPKPMTADLMYQLIEQGTLVPA